MADCKNNADYTADSEKYMSNCNHSSEDWVFSVGGSTVTKKVVTDDIYFEGITDVTINQGADFDPTEGVSVHDGNGNELPFEVVPSELTDPCEIGEHDFEYKAYKETHPLLPTWCNSDKRAIYVPPCNMVAKIVHRIVTVVQSALPTFSGLVKAVLNVGQSFDPMSGVSATDANGNPIEDITYSGTYDDEAKGKIASFETEFAQNAKVVETSFEPIQGGTPWMSDTVESTPYNFRRSGGGNIDHIFNSVYEEVVGTGMTWNQLLSPSQLSGYTDNGITTTISGNTVTVSGTASGIAQPSFSSSVIVFKPNHIYYLAQPQGASPTTYFVRSGSSEFWEFKNIAKSVNGAQSTHFRIYVANGQTVDFSFQPMYVDLTLAFGRDIAEYIYSLEQAELGAGVAWLKTHFSKAFERYQTYNQGALTTVTNLKSRDVVAFNQWDEQWELGGLDDSNGQPVNYTNRIRSKNYIPIFPNTVYYIRIVGGLYGYLYFYDVNNKYISHVDNVRNQTFTTPSNARFMKFFVWKSGWENPTYNNDICINFSDTSYNGYYGRYYKRSYPFQTVVSYLRGVFKLVNNEVTLNGDIYRSKGEIERHIHEAVLGTLSWSYSSDYDCFYASVTSNSSYPQACDYFVGICTKYPYVGQHTRLEDKSFGYIFLNNIAIRDSDYGTDATAFKRAMSSVRLQYEIETPRLESASAYANPQLDYRTGTEEYITSSIAPVGHNTRYANIIPLEGWNDVKVMRSGKNLFNELWESGTIATQSGEPSPSNSSIRAVEKVAVMPSTDYVITHSSSDRRNLYFFAYREDGSLSRYVGLKNTNQFLIQTRSTEYYLWFYQYNNLTPPTDMQIEVGTTATEYEQFKGVSTYTEEFEVPLRTDDAPYLMKKTESEDGEMLKDEIVGASISLNQLIRNGTFETTDGWSGVYGTITASNNELRYTMTEANINARVQQTDLSIYSGHKYLISVDVVSTKPITVFVRADNNAWATTPLKQMTRNVYTQYATIANADADATTAYYYCNRNEILVVNDVVRHRNAIVIDLTLAFGSQIANYVYGLETATAGAGVEWLKGNFKELFTSDSFSSFNQGEIKSIEGLESHKIVGFNAWDEEWEQGALNNIGQPSSAQYYIRSKNFIDVMPNTNYFFKSESGFNLVPYAYDANGNYLRMISGASSKVTVPSDVYKLKFTLYKSRWTDYENHPKVYINISDVNRNGEYEPYEEYSYPLDSTKTLRGKYYLDANNQLRADGDVYKSSGEIERKWKELDISATTVNISSDPPNANGVIRFVINTADKKYGATNVISNLFQTYDSIVPTDTSQEIISGFSGGFAIYIGIKASRLSGDLSTADSRRLAFKNWCSANNFQVQYELATPTTEQADAYVNPQRVISGGTQQYVSTSLLPVGNHTEYLTNEVYGGTIDLVSGVLTMDRAFVVLKGQWQGGSFEVGENTVRAYYASSLWTPTMLPTTASDSATIYADNLQVFNPDYIYRTDVMGISENKNSSANGLWLRISKNLLSGTTQQDLANWLRDNPITVSYKVANPQTYQLTRHQISLFLGQNDVLSDTNGETRVVFMKNLPQSGSVTYPLAGTYEITYEAEDQCGNVGTATREVEVTAS